MDIEAMTMLQEPTIGEEPFIGEGGERRRSHREPVVTHGTVRALDRPREAGRQVLVNDVSLHGVGIRATFELKLEEFLTIEIGVGPLHLTSRMKIVRVRALPDGTFDIGAEFC
jgi:hypothetical protein